MISDTNHDNNTEPAEPQGSGTGSADDAAMSKAERDGQPEADSAAPREIGGRKGPDPSRYGDWEKKGRCIDF